jgi:hypothetical protein
LTPKYDEPLSAFAFKFNLRRYIMALLDGGANIEFATPPRRSGFPAGAYIRPLLSSTRVVSDTKYTLNTP